MGMDSGTADYWRDYFRTANSGVFDVIEHAILVAATDYPKEFRLKRDKIAEVLFSCRQSRCSGCDRVEKNNENTDSKVVDDDQIETKCSNYRIISPYSSDDAENLVDEIEEQNQVFDEILRIKQILDNFDDETDSILFESLRRLQLMALTVETLKESEIGKSVSKLRKHASKDIRNLARALIDLWKQMVDEWVIAREALAPAGVDDGTPNSNPSGVDDEEGLPSPPLDEAFFAAQPISMELSQFFDGMDDDGNPQNYRRPSMNNRIITKAPNQEKAFNDTKVVQQVKKQEVIVKPMPKVNKPVNAGMQQRANNVAYHPQKIDKGLNQNGTTQHKIKGVDDVKLEAAKRKLQQNYQQIENAKRQRTIQVMEINELPKQGLGHKNAYVKSSVLSRNRMNGRR